MPRRIYRVSVSYSDLFSRSGNKMSAMFRILILKLSLHADEGMFRKITKGSNFCIEAFTNHVEQTLKQPVTAMSFSWCWLRNA